MDWTRKYHKLRTLLEEKYGEPIGEGRHRTVFHDRELNEVIKVPKCESGDSANSQELNTAGEYFAKTRLDEWATEIMGRCVIRMEYVEHVGSSEKPDWTWSVDGGQVGRTRDGRLVAYDWDRY